MLSIVDQEPQAGYLAFSSSNFRFLSSLGVSLPEEAAVGTGSLTTGTALAGGSSFRSPFPPERNIFSFCSGSKATGDKRGRISFSEGNGLTV